jgi:3-methylfumaryl-CoA hydratase
VATPPDSEPRDWHEWIGRTEQRTDVLTSSLAAALAATLDHDPIPSATAAAPPALAHWLLFPPLTRQSALDDDGHARRGGFLPPVPLPRRMWAGGRLHFHDPLCVGDEVRRLSRIAAIQSKRGRSGALVFVTVCHELSTQRGLALIEEQDIVYREAVPASLPAPTPRSATTPAADFERSVTADPMLLFRYSALTFNSHRIHYDLPYAMRVEGYPGLVVHGPLIATLLLDLLYRQRPAAPLRHFSFRAQQPLFAGAPFAVCGRWNDARSAATLWTRGPEGQVTMQAEAES